MGMASGSASGMGSRGGTVTSECSTSAAASMASVSMTRADGDTATCGRRSIAISAGTAASCCCVSTTRGEFSCNVSTTRGGGAARSCGNGLGCHTGGGGSL